MEPSAGRIYPGESVAVKLSVFIDTATLRALMRGGEHGEGGEGERGGAGAHAAAAALEDEHAPAAGARAISTSMQLVMASIEDVLRVQLSGGRDHLVPVNAQLLRSCFGCSLRQLVRTRAPVRSALLALGTAAVRPSAAAMSKVASSGTHEFGARQLANAAAKQAAPSECFASAVVKPLCVPKELWRLADALVANDGAMLRVPGIFTQRGDGASLADVLEALDTGAAFDFDAQRRPAQVSVLLCTVTFYVNLAHSLTRSP